MKAAYYEKTGPAERVLWAICPTRNLLAAR